MCIRDRGTRSFARNSQKQGRHAGRSSDSQPEWPQCAAG